MKKWAPLLLLAALAALTAGCESRIQPLRPMQTVEVWVEDAPETLPATAPAADQAAAAPAADGAAPASAPASAPATEPALATAPTNEPATQPTTRPGRNVTRLIDPNETSQFIYNANYDNVWRQGIYILTNAGFALDRQDYRLGVLSTRPLPSAQIVEFWRPHATTFNSMMENTVNNQRRWVKLTISKVEGKPEFYQIAIQVLVERETNPEETLNGPIFIEGSGFGRNVASLRSDYAPPNVEPGRWVLLGHDPDLERKLLDVLFKRI